MVNRRQILAGTGGLAAAMALPAGLHAAVPGNSGALPPRLQPGDRVGLVRPASFSDRENRVEDVEHTIRGMGLVPVRAANLDARFGYLAGTDRQRAADLNAMFADPLIKAIFAMRGGWGSARLLSLLEWDVIRDNPKLLIGFSDITALHLAFAKHAGYATIHGPNGGNEWPAPSWDSLWRLAFAGATPVLGNGDYPDARDVLTLRGGVAQGRLLGGNLSVLSALVGTPWLPDFDGAVLFLEDVGEAVYRVDRMLSQLALSGILPRVAGVVFGQCTRCDGGGSGFTVTDVLRQYLVPLEIPAFTNANIGHVAGQLSLPSGAAVEMDATSGTIRLLEPIAG